MRSAEPVSAETGGGLVLLSLANGKYFGLNETGQAIWDLLASPISIEDLSLGLQARFNVEPEKARTAAQTFVGRLIDERVATICG